MALTCAWNELLLIGIFFFWREQKILPRKLTATALYTRTRTGHVQSASRVYAVWLQKGKVERVRTVRASRAKFVLATYGRSGQVLSVSDRWWGGRVRREQKKNNPTEKIPGNRLRTNARDGDVFTAPRPTKTRATYCDARRTWVVSEKMFFFIYYYSLNTVLLKNTI